MLWLAPAWQTNPSGLPANNTFQKTDLLPFTRDGGGGGEGGEGLLRVPPHPTPLPQMGRPTRPPRKPNPMNEIRQLPRETGGLLINRSTNQPINARSASSLARPPAHPELLSHVQRSPGGVVPLPLARVVGRVLRILVVGLAAAAAAAAADVVVPPAPPSMGPRVRALGVLGENQVQELQRGRSA